MNFIFNSNKGDLDQLSDLKYYCTKFELNEKIIITFQLASRNSRDIIILILKCFSAKNFMINSRVNF